VLGPAVGWLAMRMAVVAQVHKSQMTVAQVTVLLALLVLLLLNTN
jgi:hypothetical protein